jgi:hypothetical protein
VITDEAEADDDTGILNVEVLYNGAAVADVVPDNTDADIELN